VTDCSQIGTGSSNSPPSANQSSIFGILWRDQRNTRVCRASPLPKVTGESGIGGLVGFESLPLRHAVCNAERTRSIPLKIARNRRNYADFVLKPYWRKCPTLPSRQALWPFSLKGTLAVRFQRLRQANAMRSQTDHSAKARVDFLVQQPGIRSSLLIERLRIPACRPSDRNRGP